MAKQQKTDPEPTTNNDAVGTDNAQEAAGAATSEAAAGAAAEDKTDEIAETYQRARQELTEAVSKLRTEISKLDVDKARQQARTWVEENPTLAVFLALGAGILAGRLLAEALKPAPPPPLSQRLRSRGRELAGHAQEYARDVSEVVAERASEVGDVIVRRARELGEDVSRRARDLGTDVTRRAADAVSAASDRAGDWGEAVHEQAADLPGAVKARAAHGGDVVDTLFNTAKTVTAALLVKKVTDWLRRGR